MSFNCVENKPECTGCMSCQEEKEMPDNFFTELSEAKDYFIESVSDFHSKNCHNGGLCKMDCPGYNRAKRIYDEENDGWLVQPPFCSSKNKEGGIATT